MTLDVASDSPKVWKETRMIWTSFAVISALLLFTFYDGLHELVAAWEEKEEYSYGYIIPFLTLFFVWQKKDLLERIPFSGTWWGVTMTALGLGLFVVGSLSTFYHVMQYAFLTVLFGLVLAYTGVRGFKILAVPLLILVFMIPLPGFIFSDLSNQLQLASSAIGVTVIRLFGISVFLDGNVIDLGSFKLQVVEACSGLRYLFPLMTLAFLSAYIFQGPFWKRAVIFLSSIPITVFMNSFRIGAIGIMVEYWGQSMAEGFLHDFEGWVVFMSCTALLVGEMWLLARIGADGRPLREIFGIDFPAPTPADAQVIARTLPKTFVGSAILLMLITLVSLALPHRTEVIPARQDFSTFPLTIGEWKGKNERIEPIYLDILKLDDYFIADFVDKDQRPVNFYVAYYAAQNKGSTSHSPRTCIPGGGWNITNISRYPVKDILQGTTPLMVNRTVIQKGDVKQLVYYWFQERGRNVTDETLVRWFIFWDALVRNQTYGALIRLTTTVQKGEALADADSRLAGFAKAMSPQLKSYVPD